MPSLPRLYGIADRTTLDARGMPVTDFARQLRDAGVHLVQYRDKQGSPQQVLAAAAEIAAVFNGSATTLVMNDRADLAVLAGWHAVHVGHQDMPPEAVRRVLCASSVPCPLIRHDSAHEWGTQTLSRPKACIVGVSTHNDAQVQAADAGPADYIAIGPVFATSSKADTEPAVGLEGVRRARALTRKRLVAIGGITRANARAVIEAGADSVAVIGGLFSPGESITNVARDFLRILG